MANPESPENSVDSPSTEQLLDSANSASQTVAALHVAFLAFVAYFGVIIWGTTHEDMLRISPVKLPILDVELPLTAFYNFVPWMLVLLHFNLLMQLELLSCKLWNLDRHLPNTPAAQQVRDRLFIFPFAHLIAGYTDVKLIRWLISLIVGITVIALPLFILLAAQIRFLPFHGEAITWSQRLAIWVDALMLFALWPLIASPQDKALEWWQNAAYRLLGYWPAYVKYCCLIAWDKLARLFQQHSGDSSRKATISAPKLSSDTTPKGMIVLLVSVPLVLLLSIVAVVPGSITVQTYYNPAKHVMLPKDSTENVISYFEDWLIRKVPVSWLSVAAYYYGEESCTSLPEAKKTEASILQVMFGPCFWHNQKFFPRNLDLKETKLIPKEVSLSLLTKAIDPNKQVRDQAFKEFDGLNLQNRDLRFANLFGVVLPKADLRHVQLQGAVLLQAKLQGIIGWDKTQLQGAILGGTQLQGAGLIDADLRDADLRGADLQGADLGWANLQSADLRGANLRAANLQKASLQGADLRGANLQGANLQEASLQGSSLDHAKLQGAELIKADLQAAILHNVEYQGTDWSQANFDSGFVLNTAASHWDARQQRDLVTALKPLLDAEKFAAFEARMLNPGKALGNPTQAKPLRDKARCYSDNAAFLGCSYRQQEQLATYQSEILYPALVKLACSDPGIAIGIARRSTDVPKPDDPDPIPGLAGALAKALGGSNPCVGLAALPQQTQDKLLNTAKQQKINSVELPKDQFSHGEALEK